MKEHVLFFFFMTYISDCRVSTIGTEWHQGQSVIAHGRHNKQIIAMNGIWNTDLCLTAGLLHSFFFFQASLQKANF